MNNFAEELVSDQIYSGKSFLSKIRDLLSNFQSQSTSTLAVDVNGFPVGEMQNELFPGLKTEILKELDCKDTGASTNFVYERFRWRRCQLQQICQKLKIHEAIEYTARYRMFYFFDHKTAVCTIPKSASSTWREHLRLVNCGPPHHLPITDDARLKQINNQSVAEILQNLKGLTKIITHHAGMLWPDRFHEFWLPALLVNDLVPQDLRKTFNISWPVPQDIRYKTSVYETLYHRIKPQITFGQFIKLVITSHRDGVANPHWKTYHSQCSPCRMDFNYITKTETLEEDLLFIFAVFGIPADASIVENSSRKSVVPSRDFRHFKWISKALRKSLQQLLMPDIQMFAYKWPKSL
ncbi:hypothetical protein SK128_014226 [Halocaridina rubra]|uniref:Carbohydrate sulfotransferase n=1 Tax=Halocaridina rubra TaxID=373956 RepID=A0AAN9A788_HALRR